MSQTQTQTLRQAPCSRAASSASPPGRPPSQAAPPSWPGPPGTCLSEQVCLLTHLLCTASASACLPALPFVACTCGCSSVCLAPQHGSGTRMAGARVPAAAGLQPGVPLLGSRPGVQAQVPPQPHHHHRSPLLLVQPLPLQMSTSCSQQVIAPPLPKHGALHLALHMVALGAGSGQQLGPQTFPPLAALPAAQALRRAGASPRPSPSVASSATAGTSSREATIESHILARVAIVCAPSSGKATPCATCQVQSTARGLLLLQLMHACSGPFSESEARVHRHGEACCMA